MKKSLCVVGMGYVGLPLAALFAEKGFKVIGADVDERIVKLVNSGRSHIHETDASTLLDKGARLMRETCPVCGVRIFEFKKVKFCPSCGKVVEITKSGVRVSVRGKVSKYKFAKVRTLEELVKKVVSSGSLTAVTDVAGAVEKCSIIVVTVSTPLRNGKPDLSYLENCSRSIKKGLSKGKIVINKSTVSPGTTEDVVRPILESGGLKAGKDFMLAYIPERIAEGNALFEFQTMPRVCGGVDKKSTKLAADIFRKLGPEVYEVSSPAIAEAAKLFENIHRDVNIALANEFALICERLGIDVTEAIDAANTNPKTRILYPGCGVGGYCLTKDSFYLIEPAKKKGYDAEIIRKARRMNDQMPGHMIKICEGALGSLNGKKIGVFGLAFKGNTDDTRETPAKPICEMLAKRRAVVSVYDPFVPKGVQKGFGKVAETYADAAKGADCIVIAADHALFKNINLGSIKRLMKGNTIVDGRNIIDKAKAEKLGFKYYGVGR